MSEADHDARPPEGAALRRHQLRQPRRAHGRRGLHQAVEQVSISGRLGVRVHIRQRYPIDSVNGQLVHATTYEVLDARSTKYRRYCCQ